MRFLLFYSVVLFSLSLSAENATTKDGTEISDTKFPWELVIDRGKILGCIYDNKYYSIGSILIEETLPRKCKLNSAREGIWSELSDSELLAYNDSKNEHERLIAEKEKRISESSFIGSKPISREEAFIIRYIRKHIDKNSNKPIQ